MLQKFFSTSSLGLAAVAGFLYISGNLNFTLGAVIATILMVSILAMRMRTSSDGNDLVSGAGAGLVPVRHTDGAADTSELMRKFGADLRSSGSVELRNPKFR